MIEAHAQKLTAKYLSRAMQRKAGRVLIDAMRKLVPDAKQEIEVTGNMGIRVKK